MKDLTQRGDMVMYSDEAVFQAAEVVKTYSKHPHLFDRSKDQSVLDLALEMMGMSQTTFDILCQKPQERGARSRQLS